MSERPNKYNFVYVNLLTEVSLEADRQRLDTLKALGNQAANVIVLPVKAEPEDLIA